MVHEIVVSILFKKSTIIPKREIIFFKYGVFNLSKKKFVYKYNRQYEDYGIKYVS